MLNFQNLTEAHTGVNLGMKLKESLDLYELKTADIISVTQDNASNCKSLADYMIQNHGFR